MWLPPLFHEVVYFTDKVRQAVAKYYGVKTTNQKSSLSESKDVLS